MADSHDDTETLTALVHQRAAHLRRIDLAAMGNVLTRVLVSHGDAIEDDIAREVAAEESRLVAREGLEDRHHLLAAAHPRRRDPLMQRRLVEAEQRGLRGKAAVLDALRSLGVDVEESSMQRECAAPMTYTASPAIAELDAEAKRCEEIGDDVGTARARKAIRGRLDWLDERRLDPNSVEGTSLPQVRSDAAGVDGPDGPGVVLGGALEALLRADLGKSEGAQEVFRSIATADGMRASLEDLSKAQELVRFVQAALVSGSNEGNWALVRRAHAEVSGAVMARRAEVVALLARLPEQQDADSKARECHSKELPGRPFPEVEPEASLEFLAARVREVLVCLDKRFESASAADLVTFAEEAKLHPLGMAARLSLRTGAFDDRTRENETEDAAIKRVKKLYEKATRKVPTS